jgi:hypothetical protein
MARHSALTAMQIVEQGQIAFISGDLLIGGGFVETTALRATFRLRAKAVSAS